MTLKTTNVYTLRILLTICCAIFFNARPAFAEADWFTLETPHFLIHYQSPAESLAKRSASIAEHVHDIVTEKLAWVPREKTHLVLSDSSDVTNGFAIPFPYNRSVLFLSPPITEPSTSLLDYGDSWTLLIMHEYTHVVHLDKGRGFIAGLRNVFGRVPLLFPNALNTPWVLEGLGTHYETDDEAGTGRGQSSYFKMLMRGELASGFKPVRQINLPVSSWPGGYSRYLYGVYFFRFLDSQYGAGATERFVENYSDNFIPWRIGGILRQETGKQIDDLWLEYRGWLETNLGLVQKATGQTRLTHHGNLTHDLSSTGNGELFYVREDRLAPPALMRIDSSGAVGEPLPGTNMCRPILALARTVIRSYASTIRVASRVRRQRHVVALWRTRGIGHDNRVHGDVREDVDHPHNQKNHSRSSAGDRHI